MNRLIPQQQGCLTLTAAIFIVAGAGCARENLQPDVSLLDQTPPYLYSDADWAEVLSRHVRAGLVDYQALAKDPKPLRRYYALLSRTGPGSTPDQFASKQQIVAYWINAYNASVLLAVLQSYPISTIYDLTLPSLEYEYTFVLDGQPRTLGWVVDRILDESATDVRTLFLLCGASMGTPVLPDQPIRASTLERQLGEATVAALQNPSLLRIDHGAQAIFVWQEVLRRQDDFIRYWQTRRRVTTAYLFNVLLELASPEQRTTLQTAVGYSFRPLPFDRTLNDAHPPETTQPE